MLLYLQTKSKHFSEVVIDIEVLFCIKYFTNFLFILFAGVTYENISDETFVSF